MTGKVQQLLQFAAEARRRSGKGVLAQLTEIVTLRFGPGKLGASEYYEYALYDDSHCNTAAKREYLGWRMFKVLEEEINDESWRAIANDKLVFYGLMRGVGVPTPIIRAVYHAGGRRIRGIPAFDKRDALADFLRNGIEYPFFAKPVHGAFGKGANLVLRCEADPDELVLAGGRRIKVEEFIAQFIDPEGLGYLFQEWLLPDAFTRNLLGERVSSLRVNVIITAEGPRVLRATWKIPTGANVIDNFRHGATGNWIGRVNPMSGSVERVIWGNSPFFVDGLTHPDTGQPLVNVTLAAWDDVAKLCLKIAALLPRLRLQHWDVAMTSKGPVILELNTYGWLDLPQLVGRGGFYDREFQSFHEAAREEKRMLARLTRG